MNNEMLGKEANMPKMVPMFMVVSAEDTYSTVSALQELALKNGFSLYQDESIDETTIPDDCEPHSILDYCVVPNPSFQPTAFGVC